MPKTPTRSRTNITQASLERLGAPRLAALLAEQARLDKGLRDSLTRALAESAGETEFGHYIERRLRLLARARMVDDAPRAKARLRELNELRGGVVDKIAPRDTAAAIALLRSMAELAPAIADQIVAVFEQVDAWMTAVLSDLARLWQGDATCRIDDVAEFVIVCCMRYGTKPRDLVAVFAPVLGSDGLVRVRDRLQAELSDLPAESAGARWGTAGERGYEVGVRAWHLRQRLSEIADLRGDVDAFIALQLAQPRNQVQVRGIVERLLKAGRGAEALQWLDDGRYHNRLIDMTDLRLAALEATGRAEEAQGLRWQRFERRLDRAALKDYLKRLPDFEDFEAERRAMAQVLTHKSATDALTFLLAWPDPDSLARLVATRWREFGPTPSETLLATVEALRDRHPLEAVVAARCAVLSVMQRGLTRLFEPAAEALASCATLEPPPSSESHVTFIERLRETYPRQWGFWRVYDSLSR